MGEPALERGQQSWRLRGLSRQMAVFTVAGFLVGAVLAVGIDLFATRSLDATALQTWTLFPQVVATLGLFWLSRRKASKALMIMALLIAMIVVEEAFHVLNAVIFLLEKAGSAVTDWSESRVSLAAVLVLYALVAVFGLAMVLMAFRSALPMERPVLRTLTALLIGGGLFGGPVSAASAFGVTRWWLYVEESGEAIAFAAMAGYVAGLVYRSRSIRST